MPVETAINNVHQYVLSLMTVIECSLSSICYVLTIVALLLTLTHLTRLKARREIIQTATNFLKMNLTLLVDVMLPVSKADSILSCFVRLHAKKLQSSCILQYLAAVSEF